VYCPERDRLSNERDRAYSCYAAAREQFRSNEQIAPPDELRELEIAISDGRLDRDIAEMVLQTHVRLHRCLSPRPLELNTIGETRRPIIDFACFECGFPFRKTRAWLEASSSTLCPNCGKTIGFHFKPDPRAPAPEPGN
jgi:hypothetical protein